MNWQEIINNSELVYASTQEDKHFRTWSLKKTTCNISYYESFPLDDIDRIICSILYSHDGCITEEKIATILGFNVVDNFEATPKRYADKAELNIFQEIVKPALDWGLVVKITESEKPAANKFVLSDLGYRALQIKEKYQFYSAQKKLLENPNIRPAESQENMFFPFYSALGEYTDISGSRKIPYNEIKPNEIFDIEKTDLIKRHKLQSNKEIQIYKSEITKYFEFDSCQVDIRLFKQSNEYYPVIYYNNQICVEATELLNMPDNVKEKEKKIEWGLYLKLIKDPNAVLDYETIIPFEDLLEFDSLIKDTRLVWKDNRLFEFIAANADANQWFAISNHCPIEVIKSHIDNYNDKWDWTSLSMRIDDGFLIRNATKHPWNFEAISAKEDISIEVIKILLPIPELKEQEWDWDNIMPRLDFEFIKSNIDNIDFELSALTVSNRDEAQSLIAQYPDKKWNWTHISAEYNLEWILKNILNFSKHIQIKRIINRAFTSDKYVKLFCKSDNFKTLLIQSKETALQDYSPNQAPYKWNTVLIGFLEQTDFLTWESGIYTSGFECNQYIEWNYEFFEQYHSKVATAKGFSFVSKTITDTKIVFDFPDFHWDWDTISTNRNLINDNNFVFAVAKKLNFTLLWQVIDSNTVEMLFEKFNLLSFLSDNPDSWQPVTEKCSIEFVRQHIYYNWDWNILTKRFCSSIKIKALGNSKWIDKWDWKYLTRNLDTAKIYDNLDLYIDYWDWKYLTRNLDTAKIYDNLDLYIDYWDWEYLTEKLDKDFILKKLLYYKDNWYWDILLNVRLDKSDLLPLTQLTKVATCISKLEDDLQNTLWQIITRKFDYAELEDFIAKTHNQDVFHWDYAYFYNMPDFHTLKYIEKYPDCTDWKFISESKKLNKEFRYNPKQTNEQIWLNYIQRQLDNPNFKWDFKGLSKLQSINANFVILNKYKDKLDWDFLSVNSNFFTHIHRDERKIRTFQSYINFQLLSQKTDAGLSDKIISKYIKKKWDWSALSVTISTKTLQFIKEQKDKPWNWQALSAREDIKFDNDTFIELSDKDWDWASISTRADIIFDENFIEKLNNKPLNWSVVSQNKTFIPNAKTLSSLKGQTLDWTAISQNSNLTIEVLWDYRDNLKWEFITKNEKIDISDVELLNKYKDYLDWSFISQSDKFNVSLKNLKNLQRFKNKLNWTIINNRKDFVVSEDLLEPFADVLNWSNISKSMEISFTEDLIEKHRKHWDWQLLRKNPQIIDRLKTTLTKYQSEFNVVEFLERFDRTPYIYHFTHLFNAIDIIKSRKILSRNKAEDFSNVAGNLVARRSTAHNFARFYFRPQTPTQFYNECLGWDIHLITSYGKSYYYQARNLGLPKCPIPVFFKFDLKEVLMKMSDKCFYSTGNMQTNWARVEKVNENPYSINTEYLYSNCKQYSQQEFLVKEEFDFSKLDSFEIICYNDEYANLLKAQLGNDPICEKINANGWDIFHRYNRKLLINETDSEISITSEYQDSAYLSIKGDGLKHIQIINPDNIQKETATEIIAYPEIRFTKTEQPIEVHFVDLVLGKREWLVYKN